MLFAACQGAGVQLAIAGVLLLVSALAGFVSTTKRGSLLTSMLLFYTASSFFGGYVSSSLYKQMGGLKWVHSIVLTSLLFPLPLTVIFGWVNSVAIMHGSTSALPFSVSPFCPRALCRQVAQLTPLSLGGGSRAMAASSTVSRS